MVSCARQKCKGQEGIRLGFPPERDSGDAAPFEAWSFCNGQWSRFICPWGDWTGGSAEVLARTKREGWALLGSLGSPSERAHAVFFEMRGIEVYLAQVSIFGNVETVVTPGFPELLRLLREIGNLVKAMNE